MSTQLFCLAAVIFALLFGSFFAHGEEKPTIVKQGGVPDKDLWKESDVKRYMDLPYLMSLDDVVRTLEATSKIGEYEIVKDSSRPLKQKAWGLDGVSFDLRRKSAIAFNVTIHDYRYWNAMCDKQLGNATDSVDMWSRIPEYFKIKKNDTAYTITRSDGNAMQMYFDLKSRFVLGVFYRSIIAEDTPERRTTQMEHVIQQLVELIEATKKKHEDQSSSGKGAGK